MVEVFGPHIESFKRAIWQRLIVSYTVEENGRSGESTIVRLTIPFDNFRIFSFLDDTGFRTNAPGIGLRRQYRFYDDIQHSFYSGYFAGHGLKVQVLFLPNGMIGSIFVASWRVSDSGLLNMSGLDTYLS